MNEEAKPTTCNIMNKVKIAQITREGRYYIGDVVNVLKTPSFKKLRGKVQLILSSPPFPLNNKKSYGNLKGDEYLKWFSSLAPFFSDLLTDDGSLVVEIGNNWEPERPVQSLLPIQTLLEFINNKNTDFRLIQEFICYNPSRLPTPAQWVTVNRIRAVDSYTRIWWMAKSDFPKADNSKVLRPYSKAMKRLLANGKYNSGKRPSEHGISKSAFLSNNGGAISHNFFEVEDIDTNRQVRLPNSFSISNTISNDIFMRKCKELGITPHPARMPLGLASYFIEFLTEPTDLVLDPFAGSNTTGYIAALLGRKWIAIDILEKFVHQSKLRFKYMSKKEIGKSENEHQQATHRR